MQLIVLKPALSARKLIFRLSWMKAYLAGSLEISRPFNILSITSLAVWLYWREPTKLVLLGQVISRIDSQYLRVRINAEDNGICLPSPLLDVLTHMPARLPERMAIRTLAGLLRLVVFREWVVAIGGGFGFKSESGRETVFGSR